MASPKAYRVLPIFQVQGRGPEKGYCVGRGVFFPIIPPVDPRVVPCESVPAIFAILVRSRVVVFLPPSQSRTIA